MCPARRRARRTASALLEVALQSAFQEKCSYTMVVRDLLEGGSVTVRRMWAFVAANEMGWGGVSVAVAASQEPLLAQGQSIWSGRGSLEASVLGSSFIRLWAAERQLGRTRR